VSDSGKRILVTVSGPDHPGITAALTKLLADKKVPLLDIEQVVVQSQLTLCLLLGVNAAPAQGEPVLKDLLFTAKSMGLDMQFLVLDETDEPDTTSKRYAITAIGDVGAAGLHAIAQALSKRQANIVSIQQLSGDGLASVEIIASIPSSSGRELRQEIMTATGDRDMDIAVQPETLTRRSKRLVVMDMDSTLIQVECIDELARLHGVLEQVSAITERAMAGELDFTASLKERVSLLKGLDFAKAQRFADDLPLTAGAEDLLGVLRTLGYKTGVISGGFTFAADALKRRLGLDYAYANELEVKDGKLTGRVIGAVVDAQRKADLLDAIAQGEGISLAQTIAIGDGANDLPMLARAGLGIAFHGKPKLRAAADTALRGRLDRLLYLLGLRARDIAQLTKELPGS